jgi:type I restriction enzyme, S subunit
MSAAVRAGYKLTDIGMIPIDWKSQELGELASFRTGPFGSALHKSDYTGDGVPVINPMHIVDSQLVPSRAMTITDTAATKLSEFKLKPGEVIIGRRGDMGRCAVVRDYQMGWLCGTGSMIVRPGAEMDADFLQRVLSSPSVISAIEDSSVGTTMINLNQSTLRKLIIQAPTVNEQRAIAATLSDVDTLLAKQGQLIAKKQGLKQAAMQQLLTGQTRLPGFSGDWEVKRLGEIADVKTGPFGSALHESDYVQIGTPIITVEHLGEFGVTRQNLPLVSDVDCKRLRSYALEFGDIVFSRVGSVDRNALISEEEVGWLFSGRLLRVRPDKTRVFAPYLSFQFNTENFKNAVLTLAVGQTMASLNTKILKSMFVSLPKIDEQTAIAAVLSDLYAEIVALESRQTKTLALKQGMMQELLTGRIRLV